MIGYFFNRLVNCLTFLFQIETAQVNSEDKQYRLNLQCPDNYLAENIQCSINDKNERNDIKFVKTNKNESSPNQDAICYFESSKQFEGDIRADCVKSTIQ